MLIIILLSLYYLNLVLYYSFRVGGRQNKLLATSNIFNCQLQLRLLPKPPALLLRILYENGLYNSPYLITLVLWWDG